MLRIITGFTSCMALIGLFLQTANAEKADTLARMVVEDFMKALKAQDLDEVMKAVEVPWVRKKGVVRERQELEKHFKQLFAARDFSQMTYEVKEVSYYGGGDEIKKRDPKLWAEVEKILIKEDYLVRLKVKKGGADEFIAMVRHRGGKIKLVGLLEPPKES